MFKKLTYSEALAKVNSKKLKRPVLRAKNSPKLKRGSMTKPIPPKMREELANDPFMHQCVLSLWSPCMGDIQWHHALSYAGRRQNEKGSILPVCKYHHEKEAQFRKQLNAIMYTRMTDADRAKYPRKKWL